MNLHKGIGKLLDEYIKQMKKESCFFLNRGHPISIARMEIPEFYRREGRGRKVGNQPERGEEARGVT